MPRRGKPRNFGLSISYPEPVPSRRHDDERQREHTNASVFILLPNRLHGGCILTATMRLATGVRFGSYKVLASPACPGERPSKAAGIARVKSAKSIGVRTGN